MTPTDWLRLGVAEGWCGRPLCSAHDGTPYTADEADRFEHGEDPCVFVVRLAEAFP